MSKVFDSNQNDQTGAPQEPTPNDQPSLFHVGDGKKYGSIDELDKAYGHLNEHTGKLEQENQELRKKLDALDGKEDAVQKILEALKPKEEAPDQKPESKEEVPLEDVVRSILNQDKQQTEAERNTAQVRDELTARYGDKAAEVYAQKAKELGVDLDTLSAQSPKAVLAYFPKAEGNDFNTPTSGNNTYNLRNQEQEDPDKALFDAGKITREELYRRQWRQFLARN